MTKFGFHPLADMAPPAQVLEEGAMAVRNGFEGLFVPDHFHPWTVALGTPFAWAIVSALAERVPQVPVGTAVTCPILRYNPAVVAQAFATLGAVYEGRIFLGVGTGEALNEVPTGNPWPEGKVRLEMLTEALEVIRLLWDGGHADYDGRHYRLRGAKLYTLPKHRVPVYVSGFGPRATELAGRMGDGWITGGMPESHYKEVLFPALEKGLRAAGADTSEFQRVVELLISYDEDMDRAVESCRQIAGALVPAVQKKNIHDPRLIKAYADGVSSKTISDTMLVYDDAEGIISKLDSMRKLGFTWVEIASLSPDNRKFLELFRTKVLPYLRG